MEIKNQDDILALIARNLAGVDTPDELVRLKEWISCSAENRQYFLQVSNIWDATDKQADSSKINIGKALEKISGRIRISNPKRNIWEYWQKIAAILLLPFLCGTLLWIYRISPISKFSNDIVYNEVFAAFGTRMSVRLSDSTLVWLNSGSSLRYPNKFDTKNRIVFFNGEGYFEVKNEAHTAFIVKTPSMEVKATGTKFNILDYKSNPLAAVTLVSGKVIINESSESRNKQIISELLPDQHLIYNKETKDINISREDSYRFIAWKDGKLIFRNDPLDNVLSRISMIFNVDIELQGEGLKDYRYHATFQEESLEEILKLLKYSAPIGFKEVKRQPFPDGSFPKKKIIVFPA